MEARFGRGRDRVEAVWRGRIDELRASWLSILQVGVAAAAAWLLARELIGHAAPFFAPVAAVLTLGLSVGQRGRRAFELALGVALGIGIADVLALLLGTGTWQLGLIVSLSIVAAVLAGGGILLVNQAAVSAVLIVTLQPPDGGISGDRFVDALIGVAVALAANAVAPFNPLRLVRRDLQPLLADLAEIFEMLACALEHRDRQEAERALARGRASDPDVERVRSALAAGIETTRMSPPRRRARGRLDILGVAVVPVDHAIRNSRVLARNVLRSVDLGDPAPPSAVAAVRELSEATRALDRYLWDPGGAEPAERAAARAAAMATAALEDTSNLSVSAIVSQVRSIAVDLLRASGVGEDASLAAVRRPDLPSLDLG